MRPPASEENLKKGLALVHARANALWHPNAANLTREDLVSIGKIVLYERAPFFDAAHKALFTTFLFPYVDGAMRTALRTRGKRAASSARSPARRSGGAPR